MKKTVYPSFLLVGVYQQSAPIIIMELMLIEVLEVSGILNSSSASSKLHPTIRAKVHVILSHLD